MLSQKTRYAFIALQMLAREYNKGPINISVISQSEKIPQRFLESILLELKKNGYLSSKLGKLGGYYLLKAPEKISLLDIYQQFEGPVALLKCISQRYYEPCEFCKDESLCKIKKVFKDIRDSTVEKLAGTKLSDLIEN
jgi:Rrf2 family protein